MPRKRKLPHKRTKRAKNIRAAKIDKFRTMNYKHDSNLESDTEEYSLLTAVPEQPVIQKNSCDSDSEVQSCLKAMEEIKEEPGGLLDPHKVFLPSEPTMDEAEMTVQVKEEIMIEDVVGNFNPTSPFDTHENHSGEEFESEDTVPLIENIKEEIIDDEIEDHLESTFPFVKCEYRFGEEEEPQQHNEEETLTGTDTSYPHQPLETDPLSTAGCEETPPELADGGSTTELHSCADCEETFTSKQSLGLHRVAFHIRLCLTRCKRCKVTFPDLEQLEQHKCSREKTKRAYCCPVCSSLSFATKQELEDHIRSIHPKVKTYQCPECDKWFSQARYLRQHQRHLHPNINPYTCEWCGRSFTTLSRFLKHEKTHSSILHGLLNNGKSSVETDVVSKCAVVLSEDVAENPPPIGLEESESGDKELNNPVIEDNTNDSDPPVDQENPNFICKVRGKLCLSRNGLDSHKQIHSEEPFSCILCMKTFSNNKKLENHHRRTHSRPFQCPKCDNAFTDTDSLFTHLDQTHAADKPFHCNRCDSYFSQRAQLVSHRCRTITQRYKLNTCKVCRQGFTRVWDRIQHEMTYQGEYVCNECGQTFLFKSSLRVHLRQKHVKSKGNLFCEYCRKFFKARSNFWTHYEECSKINGGLDSSCDEMGGDGGEIGSNGGQMSPKVEAINSDKTEKSSSEAQALEPSIELKEHQETLITQSEPQAEDGPASSDEVSEIKPIVRVYSKRKKPNLKQPKAKRKDKTPSFAFIDCGDSYPQPEDVLEDPGRYSQDPRSGLEDPRSDSQDPTSDSQNVTSNSTQEDSWKEQALRNLNLGLNPFPCDQCDRSFLNMDALKSHKLESHLYRWACDQCDRSFLKMKALKSHKLESHLYRWACDQCDRSFLNMDALKSHKHESHKYRLLCDQCDRTFTQQEELLTHRQTHHSQMPTKFSCEVCGRNFHREAALTVHKKLNACVKPFKCEACGDVFKTLAEMEHHRRQHSRAKSFPCRLCDRTYLTKRHLHQHELKHLQKPYRCNVCNKCFEVKSDLESHRCKVHDLTPIVCSENIMITGVPKTKRENEKDILEIVGKVIGLEVDFKTVMTVHRIPHKNKDEHPNLVARFMNQELRNLWLQKYREKRILLASDINQDFPHTRVTIEEHLTLFPTA